MLSATALSAVGSSRKQSLLPLTAKPPPAAGRQNVGAPRRERPAPAPFLPTFWSAITSAERGALAGIETKAV